MLKKTLLFLSLLFYLLEWITLTIITQLPVYSPPILPKFQQTTYQYRLIGQVTFTYNSCPTEQFQDDYVRYGLTDGHTIREDYFECPYEHRPFQTFYENVEDGQIKETTSEWTVTSDWSLSDISLRLLYKLPNTLGGFKPYGKNLWGKAVYINGSKWFCYILLSDNNNIQVLYRQMEEVNTSDKQFVSQYYRITFKPTQEKIEYEEVDSQVYAYHNSSVKYGRLESMNHMKANNQISLEQYLVFNSFEDSSSIHHIVFFYDGDIEDPVLTYNDEVYVCKEISDFVYETYAPLHNMLLLQERN